MFYSKIKKRCIRYPCKPQFYYMKWGAREYELHRCVIKMVCLQGCNQVRQSNLLHFRSQLHDYIISSTFRPLLSAPVYSNFYSIWPRIQVCWIFPYTTMLKSPGYSVHYALQLHPIFPVYIYTPIHILSRFSVSKDRNSGAWIAKW